MNRLQRRMAAMAAMAILVVLAVAGGSSAGARDTRAPRTSAARRSPCSCPTRSRPRSSRRSRRPPASRSTTSSPAGTRRTPSSSSRTPRAPTSPTWPSSTGRSRASSPAPSGSSRSRACSRRRCWPTWRARARPSSRAARRTPPASRTTSASRSTTRRCSRRRASRSSRRRSPELGQAAEKLKASGVKYPLSIPMAATEGGVTPWYLLTLANGGQLFDKNFKPTFQQPGSAGYKALQWEAMARQEGLGLARRGVARRRRRLRQVHRRPDRDRARDRPRQPRHGERPEGVEHRRLGGGRARARRHRPERVVRTARGALDPGHGQAQGGRGRLHRVVAEAGQRDRDLQEGRQPALRRLGHQAARGHGRAGGRPGARRSS